MSSDGAMTSEVYVPPAWRDLDLSSLRGTLMVIGATDTGKTTLVRYLVGRLAEAYERVGYLDLDVGQSTLGLPTTMNAAIYSRAASQEERWRRVAAFFVGATSPRGHMLPTVVGSCQLLKRVVSRDVPAVVIDTTGLVAREAGGEALKQWKIALLQPETVLALQRDDELGHILGWLRADQRRALFELPVSRHVSMKEREDRRAHRRRRFARYFDGASTVIVNLEGMPVFGGDAITHGRLLALQDRDGFALGLGVTERFQGATNRLQIRTPISDLGRVQSLRFGSLELDPTSGEELAQQQF